MPTGYTSDLYEGKPQTFPEFVISCAHNFGPLILARDYSPTSPLPPDFFEPNVQREDELIAKYEADLIHFTGRSEEDLLTEWKTDDARRRAVHADALVKSTAIRVRYEKMLVEVNAWTPPPTHTRLKEFMVEQLVESIEADTGWPPQEYESIDFHVWVENNVATAERMAASYRRLRAEKIEAQRGRGEWFRTLLDSLPSPS